MRKLVSLLSLFAFFLYLPMAYSQNSDDAIKELKKRYPVLMKTYGEKLQNLEVEYIVAIDLSLTMNKTVPNGTTTYIDEVKRGIIQFLTAIPDQSKISIIGFGTTVRWIQIPTVINSSTRASISRGLSDLKADERDTDLKGAVNFLEEGCSSTSTIKYLFTFTDFNNDPPATSPFLNTSWEELQRKFALISKTSLIEAFALKLPLGSDSGRDLPSVRVVFPGLNVIEFDAASLQNWFSDRAGKLMEQNLWTFVSKELQKIQNSSAFNLKAELGLNGQVQIAGQVDHLPGFIEGLTFTEIDNQKISGGNGFIFSPSKITQIEKSCIVGKINFKESSNPVCLNNQLSGVIKGKIISPASDEIEKLYALVSLKQNSDSKVKDNKSADSLMTYTQIINAGRGFLITWPFYLFLLTVCFVLIFIFFTIKNTVLPNKIKDMALYVESHTAISTNNKYKLPVKQCITIGNEKTFPDIAIKGMEFNAKIMGKRGCPFNLLVRKSNSFWHSNLHVGTVELNGKPLSKQSFKIKPNDKITIRQGPTYSFSFCIKPEITKSK